MITVPGIEADMIANNLTPAHPTHPGEFLREELECRGISQTRLANELGIQVSLLNELINGKRDFSVEYAMMIEAALGIEAEFWINLQAEYDKGKARLNRPFMERIAKIRRIVAAL